MTYSDVEEKPKINYKEMFAKLFTWQNIVIYILTFMISEMRFGNTDTILIAPFGIALVAAAISSGMPVSIVYIASLIGTGVKFGAGVTFMYIITSAVFLVLFLIKKPLRDEEQREQVKLGGYLFFSIMLVSVVKMLFSGFLMYDLLTSLILGIAAYIFYKIFVGSINVIREYGIKKAFSIEEVCGASLLITLAVSSLGSLSILGFSIRNIVSIFVVLVLGFENGILVGGVSGITVGLVLGIIGDGNPVLIATYAISGMLAGLLNRFGKIGVILGFVLGNIIIAYSANGGMQNIIMFQEILIASVGLLALPKRIKISVEDIIQKTKLLPERSASLEEGANTIYKLNNIADTVEDLSKGYLKTDVDNIYKENINKFEDEIFKAIDGIEKNLIYDYIIENEQGLIKDIFENIIENTVLTENGLIAVLAKHNIYIMNSDDSQSKEAEQADIREMVKAINQAYRICKKDAIWQRKLDEKNHNMAQELKYVKEAIKDLSKDLSYEKNENDKFKNIINSIKMNLEDNQINIPRLSIKEENSGRKIVKLYTDICEEEDGKKCPIKRIQRELEKALGERLILKDQKCGLRINSKECEYTYISEDKFYLQAGCSRSKKESSNVSGDMTSQITLDDGKHLFAISDGMGSGIEAKRNSKIAISMLEKLLSSGFDKETSINLINSNILNTSEEEMYATLDIEILDLYAGKIEFLKSGACPTYVKRGKNVSMIESTSLPAGIVSQIQIDSYDKDLEDGDILVMCSDGVLESNKEYKNRKLWIKHLLEEIQTDIPEKISDIILKEAIDNDFGKPEDDMSVVALKVVKKSA